MIHLKNYMTKIIYKNDLFNDYKVDWRTDKLKLKPKIGSGSNN